MSQSPTSRNSTRLTAWFLGGAPPETTQVPQLGEDRFHQATCLERLGRLAQARTRYRSVAVQAKGTPLGEHASWVANTYQPMRVESTSWMTR